MCYGLGEIQGPCESNLLQINFDQNATLRGVFGRVRRLKSLKFSNVATRQTTTIYVGGLSDDDERTINNNCPAAFAFTDRGMKVQTRGLRVALI